MSEARPTMMQLKSYQPRLVKNYKHAACLLHCILAVFKTSNDLNPSPAEPG